MKKGPAGPLHDAGVDAGQGYEVCVSIDSILLVPGRAQLNDTPPRASTEYSSPPAPKSASAALPADGSAAPPGGPPGLPRGVRTGLAAGTLLGSLLLIVAEFTTLFTVHVQTSAAPIKTVTTGSHHSHALIPIAVLAAALAVGVLMQASRPALLAIGLLAIVTLLIALLGDLPDANATGLAGSSATHFLDATSTPSAGMYLETVGAAILLITSGVGLIAVAAPPAQPARRRAAAHRER
jgi:hypothetical protein